MIDVGCGTGYVSAQILEGVSFKPEHWRLLDFNLHMLSFAYDRLQYKRFVQPFEADIRYKDAISSIPASDVAFVCLSLLELKVDEVAATNLLSLTKAAGSLIIIIPDLIADIAFSPDPSQHLIQYIGGYCELTKVDRDFGGHHPFCATRIEILISYLLAAGSSLRCLETLDSPTNLGTFFSLHFVRSDLCPSPPS